MSLKRNEQNYPNFNGNWLYDLAQREMQKRAQMNQQQKASMTAQDLAAAVDLIHRTDGSQFGMPGYIGYDISPALQYLQQQGLISTGTIPQEIQNQIANKIVETEGFQNPKLKIASINGMQTVLVAPYKTSFGVQYYGNFKVEPDPQKSGQYHVQLMDGTKVNPNVFMDFMDGVNETFGFQISEGADPDTVTNPNATTEVQQQDSNEQTIHDAIKNHAQKSTGQGGYIAIDLSYVVDSGIPIETLQNSQLTIPALEEFWNSLNSASSDPGRIVPESFSLDPRTGIATALFQRQFINDTLFGDWESLYPENINENTKYIGFSNPDEAKAFQHLNPQWKRRGDSAEFTPPGNESGNINKGQWEVEQIKKLNSSILSRVSSVIKDVNNYVANGVITQKQADQIKQYNNQISNELGQITSLTNELEKLVGGTTLASDSGLQKEAFVSWISNKIDKIVDKVMGKEDYTERMSHDFVAWKNQLEREMTTAYVKLDDIENRLQKMQRIPGMSQVSSKLIDTMSQRLSNARRAFDGITSYVGLNVQQNVQQVQETHQQAQAQEAHQTQRGQPGVAPTSPEAESQLSGMHNAFQQQLQVLKESIAQLNTINAQLPDNVKNNVASLLQKMTGAINQINYLDSSAQALRGGGGGGAATGATASSGGFQKEAGYDGKILTNQLRKLHEKVAQIGREEADKIENAVRNMIVTIAAVSAKIKEEPDFDVEEISSEENKNEDE